MTGKKDESCGTCDSDSATGDALSPMRQFGGPGPASYQSGPTHVDRADFRTGDDAAEASAETPAAPPEAEAKAEAEADAEAEAEQEP